MTRTSISDLSDELVVRAFESACVQQSEALKRLATRSYNKFFQKMVAAEDELKARQKRALLATLLDHAEPHVRYQAALSTLALFPTRARAVVQQVADDHEWPSDVLARGTLRMLDDGSFVPT